MATTLFEELKAYIQFGPEDEARLVSVGPRLAPFFPPIVDDFYARIRAHEGARTAITGGDAQVERLKGTLRAWMARLFVPPWDEAYFEQRARIGRMHVVINLPQQFMLTAMNAIRIHLCLHIRDTAADAATAALEEASLHRLLDMELAIMLHTYREDYLRQMQRSERLATYGQLVGGIGHELRNPLSVIESSLFLLRGRLGAGDERAVRHMDKIGAQVQLSNRIITELLDIIREKPPLLAAVAPHDLVDMALDGLPIPAGGTVHNRVDPALPRVRVDAAQVRQVFTNLIQNGLEAAGEQAVVTLSAQHLGDHVAFLVSDNGVGIPPEVRGRLFEPLVTTKARGVGLGLALCKKLVERNHGSIHAHEATAGAVFEVRLQVHPEVMR